MIKARKLIKNEDGTYQLSIAGKDQYVQGADAIRSLLLQRLSVFKNELMFSYPSYAYTSSIGLPLFEKLNQFELDLEIKKIIRNTQGVKNIITFNSQKINGAYSATFVVDTVEGEIEWTI